MNKRVGCWLGVGLFVIAAIAFVRSCVNTKHPPTPKVELSDSGIISLFEAECFGWRSFSWARRNYLVDRNNCSGDDHCQASLVSEAWEVRTTDPRLSLEMKYFFDETSNPTISSASCSVAAPDQLRDEVLRAGTMSATKRRLIGPLEPTEDEPAYGYLKKFWVDENNKIVLGLQYLTDRPVGFAPEKNPLPWVLLRYPPNTPAMKAKPQRPNT